MGSKALHGMTGTRFYKIWGSIKRRCCVPKHSHYHLYGGRGIKMCDDWKNSFTNFMADMYESYIEHADLHGEENTSIDRIDCDGDYTPENCRWATRKEQQQNLRNNIRFTVLGTEYTVESAAKQFGLNPQLIRTRVYSGKTDLDIVAPKMDLTLDKQSGIKGVVWDKKSGKWRVKGLKNGVKDKYIKSFADLHEAIDFKKKWDEGLITLEDLKVRDNNTTGLVGIRQMPNGRWKATIQVKGKAYIKTFDTQEQAVNWRESIKNKR